MIRISMILIMYTIYQSLFDRSQLSDRIYIDTTLLVVYHDQYICDHCMHFYIIISMIYKRYKKEKKIDFYHQEEDRLLPSRRRSDEAFIKRYIMKHTWIMI